MNSDMYYKIKMMKEDMDQSIKIHELRKECKELIKSREQKKSSSPKKKAHGSKGADLKGQATREHSGQALGNREGRKVKKSKIKSRDKKAKSKRANKKKDTDTIRIQDENLNIVSINARGFASKRKSIEEILKNENVDIAIVSELSGKNISTFTGYKPFIKSGGHMHGLAIFVRNSIAKRTLRIHDESDLEIVHLRLSSTVPALNIIGTYLQVESRQTVDNINRVWNLYTEKVQHVLDRGEALLCIGDFNRPLQTKRLSHGTKLLNEWLDSKNMILVNDKTVNTRTDPARGSGSVLDLALISANIEQSVMNFEVDTQQKMTAFKMVKRRDKTVEKVFTDHFTIKLEIKIPMKMFRKGKKKKIIDFRNSQGWARYPDITDKYAGKIIEAVQNIADPDKLEEKVDSIDKEIQAEAFGFIYVKERDRPKKIRRKSSKNLNELYEEHLKEVDKAITECLDRRDVYSRMYKLKTLINGPKIKPQEQAAINDPKTNVLITDEEKIKEVSLAHNVEILTKMKPLPQYEYLIKEKQEGHNEMMGRNLDEDNWTLDINFYRKVTKRIKDKNKNTVALL